MCGIAGKLNFSRSIQIDQELLSRMCEVIRHRGPDDVGYYINKNVGLGMRRLSIIDLEKGHQPISNEDNSVWVVFNGEIYNFLELRKELVAKNHIFRTKTDTEVIVHLYEDYGEECVKKLRGMFAFALWDQKEQKLFIARDRIGQKPLYYSTLNNSLIFGSELKTILQDPKIEKRINREALDDYLTCGFVPSPKTIFEGINKLPPAHYLTCKNGQVKSTRYWSVKYNSNEKKEEIFYTEQLEELIREAVRLRLVSDVPLGAFLSGGLDSSLIVALMSDIWNNPVKTFAIGYKENSYNELQYARIVADHFGTNHHELEVECEVENILPKLVRHFDEPFADAAAIPNYYVSRMAKKDVTVSLSGDAADELFGGYRRYQSRKITSYFNHIPRWARVNLIEKLVKLFPESDAYYGKSTIKKLKRFIEYSRLIDNDPSNSWLPFFSEEEKDNLYNRSSKSDLKSYKSEYIKDYFSASKFHTNSDKKIQDPISQMMWVDLMTSLPEDMLTRVDRMSMANSLEVRSPLLDHKIVEFMATVPTGLKLKGLTSKYILKKTVEHLLPKQILHRSKQGFVVPIASWLKNDLKPYVGDLLLSETSRSSDYFNQAYIKQLVNDHQNGRRDNKNKIWALLVFEVWYRTFMDGNKNDLV